MHRGFLNLKHTMHLAGGLRNIFLITTESICKRAVVYTTTHPSFFWVLGKTWVNTIKNMPRNIQKQQGPPWGCWHHPCPPFTCRPAWLSPHLKQDPLGTIVSIHLEHSSVLMTLAQWPGVLIPLLPGPYGLTQITLLMPGYSSWKQWTRFIEQINAPPWRRTYTLPFTVPSLQYLSLW